MTRKLHSLWNKLLKDKDGKVVLMQMPNIPIVVWIICTLLTHLLGNGATKTGFEQLGRAALFTWAYLEVTDGVNYFRKILGAVVLAMLCVGFFAK